MKLTAHAREAALQRVTERAEKTSADLSDLAEAFHATSKQLSSHFAAPYVDKLGVVVEHAARFVGEACTPGALDRAESVARRKPWLVVGGALAFGLVSGRVLKGMVASFDAPPTARHT